MSAGALVGLEARAVDPAAYALGGRPPRAALRPASAAEVAEALRAAGRDGMGVVPWGGGTAIARERALERYDLALDLGALDRILEYDPEDFTLTAQCGATLETLCATLAARRQELPLESPLAARATLGGVLAANASGPRRLRFGAPRDRILGARIALADGTPVRSGGKVVKNVAGFALHRLLCGSGGTLAVFLEASLKLAPAPAARAALIFGSTRDQLLEARRWSFLPRLEPSFVTVLGAEAARGLPPEARVSAAFLVAIGLEDDAARVAEQERVVAAALGTPAMRLEDDAVVALTQALADADTRATPRLTFTSAHNTPAALAPLLDDPLAARLVFHAAAGRLHWYPGGRDGSETPDRQDSPDPSDGSEPVRELFRHGFTLIGATGAVRAEPAIPPEAAVLALRARIRQALDPAGILALGGPQAA